MNIEALKEKHANEIEAAEREQAIREAIETAGLPDPRFVYTSHRLYGTVAGVSWGDSYAVYGKEPLSWETVQQVADAFPAEGRIMVRDGCLSFPPASHVESLPEEKKERWQSETAVCPVTVTLDAVTQWHATLEWYATIPGVGLLSIACDFAHIPKSIGSCHARRVDYMGGHRYEKTSATVADSLLYIRDANGENIAECQRPIYWASGSNEWPGRVGLYWIDIHTDGRTTASDTVRAMTPDEA